MIEYLYLDNFRGFANTYIPLADVNFLVGENSTGKTSVLSSLKLLSTREFWSSQNFGIEGAEFRLFSDIVSAHADTQDYFRIGLIERRADNDNALLGKAHLFTFAERDRLPRLKCYSVCEKGRRLTIRFSHNRIEYLDETTHASTIEEMRDVALPSCIKDHESQAAGFQRSSKVEDEGGFVATDGRVFIPLAIAVVRSVTESKTDLDFDTFDSPRFQGGFVWIAPIRTKPRRTYDELNIEYSPEGEHTPYLIKRLLDANKGQNTFREVLRKIGEASGLFESVQIKPFGNDPTAPFEVDALIDGKAFALGNVGYGVSQSLPVVVEVLSRGKRCWFAIQQPEIHLHPRAQAALGDVFFDAAIRDSKRFIIETHSDFTIDRFRMNYLKRKGTSVPRSQILFFERKNKRNTVTPIKIGARGQLPADQPEAYRRFFVNEGLKLLEIE